PVYPIKGYSLSLPIANDDAAPRVSVTDTAQKLVYARLGNSLRVAGMADIVGPSDDLDPARLAQLTRQARATFPQAGAWRDLSPWTGLRPATPKGLPVLGECGIDNLLLNTGHGALGFTLAFGSAEAMAAQLAGRPGPAPMAELRLAAGGFQPADRLIGVAPSRRRRCATRPRWRPSPPCRPGLRPRP